jgi:quercetin dioxygenase-like cupin family protein
MRSLSWVLSIIFVVLSLGAFTIPGASAQDSTPAAGPPAEEGVTFTPVGFAEGVTLPSPADLIAVRISIEPGAVSSLGADDPTSGLLIVESGTITVRVDAAWTVSRGAALQQAMATPPASGDEFDVSETIAASEEATLSAGDVAYIPGNVNGELRNDGQEPAGGLVVVVAPGGTLSGTSGTAATPAA